MPKIDQNSLEHPDVTKFQPLPDRFPVTVGITRLGKNPIRCTTGIQAALAECAVACATFSPGKPTLPSCVCSKCINLGGGFKGFFYFHPYLGT